jgi:diacylglycerol O-acyltransferase
MRQLTSLDSQFLALATRCQTGHIASVAILDPSTERSPSPTSRRSSARACRCLPPLRWRLLAVPLGLEYPYGHSEHPCRR